MKKSNVIRSLLAILLAAAMLFGICACGEPDEPTFKTDEELLVYADTQDLAKVVGLISGMAGRFEEETADRTNYKSTKVNAKFGAKLGDSLLTILRTAVASEEEEGSPVLSDDFKWLSDISVSASLANNKYGDVGITLDFCLGNKPAVTLNVFYNANLKALYLQIPQLNEKYITLTVEEVMELLGEFLGGSEEEWPDDDNEWLDDNEWSDDEEWPEEPSSSGLTSNAIIKIVSTIDFGKALSALDSVKLSEKDLADLMNKYIAVVLGELKVAKRESATLKIGDIEKACDALTVNYSENFIKALITKIAETAKTDETLKNIYTKLSTVISEMITDVFGDDEDPETSLVIPTYEETIDDLKTAVSEWSFIDEDMDVEYKPDDPIFTVTTYLDGTDVVARKISATTYTTTYELDDSEEGYKTTTTASASEIFIGSATTDDGKEAIDFYVKEDDEYTLRIAGNGTKKDSAFTGSVTLSVSGTEMADFIFTNFSAESGAVKGSVELSFTDDAIAMLGDAAETIVSMFGSMVSVKFDFDYKADSGKVSVSVIAGSSTIIAITFECGVENSTEALTTPDGLSLFAWLLSGIDFEGFVQALTDAGVPSYITEMLFGSLITV